jgi:hypothetical protein
MSGSTRAAPGATSRAFWQNKFEFSNENSEHPNHHRNPGRGVPELRGVGNGGLLER